MAGVQKHSPGCDCCAPTCVANILHVAVLDDCTNAVLNGVTVTASKAGQSDVSGTTSSGAVNLTVPVVGAWSLALSKSGYDSKSGIGVTAVCDATVSASIYLHATGGTSGGTLNVVLQGCGTQTGVSGATVQLIRPATSDVVAGGVTGTGTLSFTGFPTSTWTLSITHPRFASFSGSQNITCGSTSTHIRALTAATGYHCAGCPVPTGDTIYVNDPVNGLVTLTWDAANSGWCGVSGSVYYRVRGSGGTTWTLVVSVLTSGSVTACLGDVTRSANGACDLNFQAPLAVTINMSFAVAGPQLQAIYGTGTRTFTVSE